MSLALCQVVSLLPVPVDPDPNAVEPPPSRVLEVPSRFGASNTENYQLGTLLVGGSSIDVTVWLKSAELAGWVRVDSKTVIPLKVTSIDGLPGGSSVFLQMTAPVGGPTSIGFILL